MKFTQQVSKLLHLNFFFEIKLKKKKQEFRLYLHFIPIVGYNVKLEFKYVRIYFDATTFDRITKDRAAKFVDKFSAIGGTMGLLTGFSIISGVEILYFSVQFTLQSLKKLVSGKSVDKHSKMV